MGTRAPWAPRWLRHCSGIATSGRCVRPTSARLSLGICRDSKCFSVDLGAIAAITDSAINLCYLINVAKMRLSTGHCVCDSNCWRLRPPPPGSAPTGVIPMDFAGGLPSQVPLCTPNPGYATGDDESDLRHIQGGPKEVNPICSTHNFVKHWPI